MSTDPLGAITLDEHGHLSHPHEWTIAIAQALAQRHGVTWNDDVRQIIDSMRAFQDQFDIHLTSHALVRLVRASVALELGTSLALSGVFGDRFLRTATLIAGLKKPPQCF